MSAHQSTLPPDLSVGHCCLETIESLFVLLQERQAISTEEIEDLCSKARARLNEVGASRLETEYAAERTIRLLEEIEDRLLDRR